MQSVHNGNEEQGVVREQRQTVHLRLSRWHFVGLVALLVIPWLLLVGHWVLKEVLRDIKKSGVLQQMDASSRVTQVKPGPWGMLEYVRIAIEPPDEFSYVEPLYQAPTRWFFRGYSQMQLAELFTSAGFSSSQVASLAEWTTYDPINNVAAVSPTPEFVLEMPAAARARIYGVLTAWPENGLQRFPFTLWPQYVDERFEDSGLPSEIIADIKRMLYPYQKILLFADVNVIMGRPLPDETKLRLVKTLARKNTLLVELTVDENSNVDQLEDYWGGGQRTKDLGPLLDSLKRVPGGAKIDIMHLLPQFARRRIYTYPWTGVSAVEARKDCHWTSMNFFNAEPDDHYADPEAAKREVAARYYQIVKPTKLGDLVLLMTSKAEVLHSAVYLADDIVFTKNGAIPTEPWRFMTIDDMTCYFSVFYQAEGALNVTYFRKKEE